jgi:hypothetical protein
VSISNTIARGPIGLDDGGLQVVMGGIVMHFAQDHDLRPPQHRQRDPAEATAPRQPGKAKQTRKGQPERRENRPQGPGLSWQARSA